MHAQQWLELLLKEIRAGQEETKTNKAELLAKMEADRKAVQEKAEADRRDLKEMMKMMHANQAKAETCHKYFLARMDADWKAW
jgi:ABC-type proline/glycine betaine transport system substrate-binding protein